MNFLENMLTFIFPPTCGICGRGNENYVCKSCMEKLKLEKTYMPQIIDYKGIKHCYIFKYEGIIRQKILQYKFKDNSYLYKMFSEFFMKNEKVCRFLKNYDIIISVPMTKKKIAQRGYNQAELIAKQIAINSPNLTYLKNILIKQKETSTQSSLNKKERFNNKFILYEGTDLEYEDVINLMNVASQNMSDYKVIGGNKVKIYVQDGTKNEEKAEQISSVISDKYTYNVQNMQKIKEKNIILFDDIYTTGATCKECTKTLMEAGAKIVDLLTIAKDFEKMK